METKNESDLSAETHHGDFRTPAIEDNDHPLNVWRSQQTREETIDSYFNFEDAQTREQYEYFRQLQRHRSKYSFGRNSNKSAHPNEHLPWRERLKHTTWAYFTMTMATGGIANVLHAVPFRSRWLEIIGLIFFILNIILYLLVWAMILTRFIAYPKTFRTSIIHPTESLFVPSFLVSLGTICITIVEYCGNRMSGGLIYILLTLFWFNVILAFTLSIGIYMILWSSLTFTIAQMTPIWIFPAYPLLVIGPHAANLSAKLPNPTTALEVIVGGFTVQGIGFLVSITIYSAFVYRLMTHKLPADPSRPAMFVSVGPAAFTCSGTLGMAANLHNAIADQPDRIYMDMPAQQAAQILRLVGNWMCLWLWGLAFWFFFVSVISNLAPLWTHTRPRRHNKDNATADEECANSNSNDNNTHTHNHSHGHRHGHRHPHLHMHAHTHIQVQKIPFAMTWFSYIFPQTALTTATFRIADAFEINAVAILGCVMTALLIAMWFFVVIMMIRAVVRKQILWPDKGEDKEEGGFVRPVSEGKGSDNGGEAAATRKRKPPDPEADAASTKGMEGG